jgi:hypothetical protein
MGGRWIVITAALAVGFGFAPAAPARACFISDCSVGTCVIADNRSDTVQTFVGRCYKGSVRSEMPGTMWSKTVGDVADNRSKDGDYRKAWKLISKEEYRK